MWFEKEKKAKESEFFKEKLGYTILYSCNRA